MKLSIITDEMTQDLGVIVDFAHTYGLSGVELRTIDDLPLEALSESRLKEIFHVLKEEGLSVCNLAGSFNKCVYSKRSGESEKFKRLLEAAGILEAPSVRCFGFLAEEPVTFEQVAEAYRRPLEEAASCGKFLMLEADPSVTTTNHALLAKLIKTVGDPNLKAIYDPGNDLYDPLGEIPFPDGYEAVKDSIAHIHIKDAVIAETGPECVCIGTGKVDYDAFLQRIIQDGYNGFLSLETHYRVGRTISENQMKLPGGASFTEGGMGACVESIMALKKLLEKFE